MWFRLLQPLALFGLWCFCDLHTLGLGSVLVLVKAVLIMSLAICVNKQLTILPNNTHTEDKVKIKTGVASHDESQLQ